MSLLRRYLPDWAIVMAVAGTVGAISAILAVAAYRDVVIEGERPLPVESA